MAPYSKNFKSPKGKWRISRRKRALAFLVIWSLAFQTALSSGFLVSVSQASEIEEKIEVKPEINSGGEKYEKEKNETQEEKTVKESKSKEADSSKEEKEQKEEASKIDEPKSEITSEVKNETKEKAPEVKNEKTENVPEVKNEETKEEKNAPEIIIEEKTKELGLGENEPVDYQATKEEKNIQSDESVADSNLKDPKEVSLAEKTVVKPVDIQKEPETEVTPLTAHEELVEEEAVWVKTGKKMTLSSPVELNETYVAPQNSNLTITFRRLPKNPKPISIEEITLSQDQMMALGAVTDKVYDITSDMDNWTFEYDLTLPKSEGAENIQIKYAENQSQLSQAKTIDDFVIKKDKIELEKLNHFTIYIATYEANFTIGKTAYAQGETVYMKATGLDSDDYYKFSIDPIGNDNSFFVSDCSTDSHTKNGSYILPANAPVGDWEAEIFSFDDSSSCRKATRVGDSGKPVKKVFFTVTAFVPADTQAPTLSLLGEEKIKLNIGESYVDPGATAYDERDGNITDKIVKTGSFDVNVPGTYILLYNVKDLAGNCAEEIKRTIVVSKFESATSLIGPETSIEYGSEVSLKVKVNGQNPSGEVEIKEDSLVLARVIIENGVGESEKINNLSLGDHKLVGQYKGDNKHNSSLSNNLTFSVVDTTSPNVILLGDNPLTIERGSEYIEAGARWEDLVDGTGEVSDISGEVMTELVGDYTVTYKKVDSSGNAGSASRLVMVRDTTPPIIYEIQRVKTLTSDSTPSYTFSSNEDGNIWYEGKCFSDTKTASKGENAVTFGPLEDGCYSNCLLKVEDDYGNLSQSLKISDFLVDTKKPSDPGAPKINKISPSKETNLTWSWDESLDATSGVKEYWWNLWKNEVKVENGITQKNELTKEANTWGDGWFNLDVQAFDEAGLLSSISSSVPFLIDTKAPTVPQSDISSGEYSVSQQINLKSTDEGSGVEGIYYTLDGSTPDKNSFKYQSAIIISHDLTLKALAYDRAGNSSEIFVSSFTISLLNEEKTVSHHHDHQKSHSLDSTSDNQLAQKIDKNYSKDNLANTDNIQKGETKVLGAESFEAKSSSLASTSKLWPILVAFGGLLIYLLAKKKKIKKDNSGKV